MLKTVRATRPVSIRKKPLFFHNEVKVVRTRHKHGWLSALPLHRRYGPPNGIIDIRK